jgi:para-aminobenzoate synthetase/4-amino-4-deoxychorismate lyase
MLTPPGATRTDAPLDPAAGIVSLSPIRLPLESNMSPGDVLRALRDDAMPFALTGRWAGGGAVLGSEPVRVATGSGVLDHLAQEEVPGPAGFVGGGWVGYYGFGLGATIERLPPSPPQPESLPLASVGLYDHVLRLDPGGRWWFEALTEAAADRRFDELRRRLRAPVERRPWRLDGMGLRGAGADGHRAAVADCVERIAAGELFQANLCLQLDGSLEGSALDAYADVAAVLQPAYGAFVGTGDGALLSFSPELFLRRRGREVESAPIKGTTPRTDDPAAAAAGRDALVASAKDAAEHVMIVDLMRNDLGRVAEYGSVSAAAAPDVEAHPGLWHLVTRVRGRLRPGVTDRDLLRATFPPGSVTGAPKIQSLKVISQLEGTGRQAYTGAIGFVSPAAGLELNVAIRTLEVRGRHAWLGCGGGIVADSDPEAELREALDKARPIVEALGATLPAPRPPRPGLDAVLALPRLDRPDPAVGLLETILVVDGRAVEADRHLRRLARSATAVFGLRPPPGLAARVAAAARASDPQRTRLRVVLHSDGTTTVGVRPASAPSAPVILEPVLLAGGLGAHKWADRTPLLMPSGFEALICDLDGAVLEAASANVWLLLDGRLVTPVADGRILEGVTRRRILEAGHLDGIPVVEGPITLRDLERAAGVLVSSAIRVACAAALGPDEPTPEARRIASVLRTRLAGAIA